MADQCQLGHPTSSGVDLAKNLNGSGSVRSSHQTRSRPKFVFVFGAENGLFGHFWLFSFSAKNEFSFSFYFSFSFQKMSFVLGWKCYVRNWTVTKFCDIGTGDFHFFGRKWNITFVGIFVYGWKWKMHLRLASTSNCFRSHPTSMIIKHSTIPVPDSQ